MKSTGGRILLASDVDGTLLPQGGGEIHPRVYEALSRFMGGGGLFTVATGRTRGAMERLRPLIPMNAPAILANGALVYDYSRNGALFSIFLDGEYMEVAGEAAARFPDVAVEVHSETSMWVLRPNRHTERHSEIVGVPSQPVDGLDVPPRPWLKAVFVAEPESLARLRAFLEPVCRGRFSLVSTTRVFLEFQHADANKGEGAARLAAALGVAPEDTYVIGDDQNDLPMITRFFGFAPQNARDDVKRAARAVVGDAAGGAVADAIDWLYKNR
ncbi:MAG: HAD-IIB family hydrolase [Oscillospiraceae bacterium]|nr:HAD-IIB family hydrolase [Oscillospiraceae bacterium]